MSPWPLGNFHKPLSVMCQLIAIKPIASAIAASPRWCPPAANGRAFEDSALIGPFFGCSALPDVYPAQLPNVREQCFSNMTQRRSADIEASQSALRSTTGQLQEGLYQVLYGMLRHGGDTREAGAYTPSR